MCVFFSKGTVLPVEAGDEEGGQTTPDSPEFNQANGSSVQLKDQNKNGGIPTVTSGRRVRIILIVIYIMSRNLLIMFCFSCSHRQVKSLCVSNSSVAA